MPRVRHRAVCRSRMPTGGGGGCCGAPAQAGPARVQAVRPGRPVVGYGRCSRMATESFGRSGMPAPGSAAGRDVVIEAAEDAERCWAALGAPRRPDSEFSPDDRARIETSNGCSAQRERGCRAPSWSTGGAPAVRGWHCREIRAGHRRARRYRLDVSAFANQLPLVVGRAAGRRHADRCAVVYPQIMSRNGRGDQVGERR